MLFVGPYTTYALLEMAGSVDGRVVRRAMQSPSLVHSALLMRRVQRAAEHTLHAETVELLSEVFEDLPCTALDNAMAWLVLCVLLWYSYAVVRSWRK
jgi:hypothetical protein